MDGGITHTITIFKCDGCSVDGMYGMDGDEVGGEDGGEDEPHGKPKPFWS